MSLFLQAQLNLSLTSYSKTTKGVLDLQRKTMAHFFLETALSNGLSKYVIRGNTIYGNTVEVSAGMKMERPLEH
jgi:hypothetical protein